ncbi:MAG: hypothetical protein ABIR59_13180 [Gemmatimonadales bacterium]
MNSITARPPSSVFRVRLVTFKSFVVLWAVVGTVSCTAEELSAPSAPQAAALRVDRPDVTICHVPASSPAILVVSMAALRAHEAHGDYVARLEVGDGSASNDGVHFARISDALAAARATRIAHDELENAACRVTIVVSAGVRPATTRPTIDPAIEQLPFIIDVPDITIRGALQMQVDETGRATGLGNATGTTTIAPSPALIIVGGIGSTSGAPEPIFIVNAHPVGSKGHGAVIEGFTLQSGRLPSDPQIGGFGVFALRVNGLVVRGNRFDGGLSSGADLRASHATVERNYLSGRGGSCDICLAGPGAYVARDNRMIGGGVPGVLILPTVLLGVLPSVEQYELPTSAIVTADIVNNEVRDHRREPVGVGLRIGAVGVGAPNVAGLTKVKLTDNLLVNNTFGIIVEAGFPRAATLLRGDIELTTSGNVILASCQRDLLVSLASSQTGLGIQAGPYLLRSSYALMLGGDLSWPAAWYSHPAGFGNTLTVNGAVIPNGVQRAYDPARVCPS